MAKKRKSTPLAMDDNGNRFVKVAAVMHPLIVFTDGIPAVQFSKKGPMYLKLEDAIAWVEKEVTQCHGSEQKRLTNILLALLKIRDTPDSKMQLQG